jgi:predicted RNase H-like nuclease
MAILLKRNRKNAVVKFKNNNYHLSGVLKCKECGGNFRGIMSITNHRTKVKRPWYRCSSKGVSYIQCNNASVSAESISKQVWDIVDVVKENLNVLEELNDMIKLNASQPEQGFLDELEGLNKQLNKNLEKQKGLFEVFSQDSINLEIYKDRAELLRNEENKLGQRRIFFYICEKFRIMSKLIS